MSGDSYIITDQHAPHFLTFTVVDWVDVFTRPVYKNIIVDSLNYCIEHKGLQVFAWCLMTNHLHVIWMADAPNRLSDIIRDFKKYTSKAILHAVQNENESRQQWMLHRFRYAGKYDKRIKEYKFWQESNHAICLDPTMPEMFDQKMDYIHDNPVRAGIVAKAEEYLYSSAANYQGDSGLVPISAGE